MMTLPEVAGGRPRADGRVRQARDALVRRTGDAVLVLGTGDEPLVLRDTSIDLWDVLEEDRSVGELVELICEGFEVSERQAMDDLAPFVDRLLADGVLEAVEHLT